MTPTRWTWVRSCVSHFPQLIDHPQTQGYYSQIELDDLQDTQASEGIALDMKNSQRYFESRAINAEDTPNRKKVGWYIYTQ